MKAKKARLDTNRKAKPKTRIVATPVSSSLGEGTMRIPPGDTYVDNETGQRIPLTPMAPHGNPPEEKR